MNNTENYFILICAGVAQLVEHAICNREVMGSTPFSGLRMKIALYDNECTIESNDNSDFNWDLSLTVKYVTVYDVSRVRLP